MFKSIKTLHESYGTSSNTPNRPRHKLVDENHLWNGYLRRGRPYLARVGNPVRVLLGLTEHPDYRIYPDHPHDCPDPHRCMNIHHWRVVPCTNPRKYGRGGIDVTPWQDPRTGFSQRDMEEIELCVQMIRDGEMTREELDDYESHTKQEILRRLGAVAHS